MLGEVCCRRPIHQLTEVVPIMELDRGISQYQMQLEPILCLRLATEESEVSGELCQADREGEDFHSSNVQRHYALHRRTIRSFSEPLIGQVNHMGSIAPHNLALERSRQEVFAIDTKRLGMIGDCKARRRSQVIGSYRLRRRGCFGLE